MLVIINLMRGDIMNFEDLLKGVNELENNDVDSARKLVDAINIDQANFNLWVNDIFSDKVNEFDMNKLPYLIDQLYQTNDKFKFMLCCMLIEATCDTLEFITNLENYPLFVAKFETMVNTLTTVYDRVDNGIANCMALIIINNDPEFKYFDDENKTILINATKRKLEDVFNYIAEHLKDNSINPIVYEDLEIIVDFSCYLKDNGINELIDKIDNLGNNEKADIFIMKYKIINNMSIIDDKLNALKQNEIDLRLVYSIMEQLGVNNKYLSDITQEQIAKSDMINWLSYPTELGSAPEKIELLGFFIFNDTKCYAFKFSKRGFSIEGDLIGISGGYPIDKITANPSGYTFSKFENISDDWNKQANELAQFIYDYWKNREGNHK